MRPVWLLLSLAILPSCASTLQCGSGTEEVDGVCTAADVDSVDIDQDGVAAEDDCNDLDENAFQLLSGYEDADYDGYGDGPASDVCSGTTLPAGWATVDGDCEPDNPAANPAADEVPYNGIDDDCTDGDSWDADGDGHTAIGAPTGSADDCADNLSTVNPTTTDAGGDNIDDDCSGDAFDADGDGEDDVLGGDCDDDDGTRSTLFVELYDNQIDDDCDPSTLDDVADNDGDGFESVSAGGTDCDDGNAAVRPDQIELPDDGIDNDCIDGDLEGAGIYVDNTNGACDDTAPGTRAVPNCTIGSAIGHSTTEAIFLAGGPYDESVRVSARDLEIHGGYDASWARDVRTPTVIDTTEPFGLVVETSGDLFASGLSIRATDVGVFDSGNLLLFDTQVSSFQSDNFTAVVANTGVSHVERVDVIIDQAEAATGLQLLGDENLVRDCTVTIVDATQARALYAGGDTTVLDSDFRVERSDDATGIEYGDSALALRVARSEIFAAGNTSTGVNALFGTVEIDDSVITGGGGFGASTGVRLWNLPSATITNSTITAGYTSGGSANSTGLLAEAVTTLTVEDNAIRTLGAYNGGAGIAATNVNGTDASYARNHFEHNGRGTLSYGVLARSPTTMSFDTVLVEASVNTGEKYGISTEGAHLYELDDVAITVEDQVGTRSYGLHVIDDATTTLRRGTVWTGSTTDLSYGVRVNTPGTTLTVEDTDITVVSQAGGRGAENQNSDGLTIIDTDITTDALTAYGVRSQADGTRIDGSRIWVLGDDLRVGVAALNLAPTSIVDSVVDTSAEGGQTSYAAEVNGSGLSAVHSVLIGGPTSSVSRAVHSVNNNKILVVNSIIDPGSAPDRGGIIGNSVTGRYTLQNNVFVDGDYPLWRSDGSAFTSDVAVLNNCSNLTLTCVDVSGNLRATPDFADDRYHLGTPGVLGDAGIDLTTVDYSTIGFPDPAGDEDADIDGDVRSTTPDIGVDEVP